MNCKRIQELIMTDYSDGEISKALKKEVEGHLNICNECRQFEQVLRKTAIEPFKIAEEIRPPDSIWNHIKETIALEKEQQSQGLFATLGDFLHGIFSVRKPVFAAATVMTLILIAVVVARLPFDNQKVISGYLEEQVDFLIYLDTSAISYSDMDYVDLGTSIEEYFL